MSALAGHELSAADFLNALSTWTATSTAGGTGVTTTETKDATGDLTFLAVSGFTYTIMYNSTAIAGAADHIIDVNIRDGGAGSPSSASTRIAGTSQQMDGSGAAGRSTIAIMRALKCPTEISAGSHTIATFYVRSADGVTTSVVQLENAGGSRQLIVRAGVTGA